MVDFEKINELGLHNEHAMQIQLAQRAEYDFVDESLLIRGQPESSRGGSPEAVEEYKRTYEYYSELYDERPAYVRDFALSYVHFLNGQLDIRSQLWSLSAIINFAKANLYHPELNPIYLGTFVSSVFGWPGYRLGKDIYQKLLAAESQRGGTV